MKWPIIVEKCVSNLDRKGKPLVKPDHNLFLSQRGMSLVEMMVVTAISSIILLAAGSLLVFVADSFVKIIDKDEAETNLASAGFALRTIATQAVNLYAVTADGNLEGISSAGNGAAAAITNGQILNTVDTAATFNDIPGTLAHRSRMVELAVFMREAKMDDVGESVWRPTGIFFKTPWHRCPPNFQEANDQIYASTRDDCSGQLIIVTNTSPNATALTGIFNAAGNQLLQPGVDYNVQSFSRLSSMTMSTTGMDALPSYARDTKVTLFARYFLSGDKVNYNYVPGDTSTNYREISLDIYVGFRNNFLKRSQLGPNEPERLHGSIYYFPFVSPLRMF